MSFYVVVTYDLSPAKEQANKYEPIREKLEKIDFTKFLQSTRGLKRPNLPANTFVRKFDGDYSENSKELRDHVKEELKRIFKECDAKGRYFIFVGQKWAWTVGKAP